MSRLRLHLAVYALYLLLALVITWPLVTVLGTRFAGFGYGDAYEMAHHLWWFKYAIQHGQPLFYQTMSGYPNGIDGFPLWTDPLQFFPAWLFAFAMPLAAAYNLTLLLTMALNGWAMCFLARHLTRGTPAAILAGLVFMAYPTMQGHLGAGHAGLMVQWPVPLYVYALARLHDTRGPRWIVLAALFFMLGAFGHTLQVIYVLLPVTALFALALLFRRDWRPLARVVAAAALGFVALGLFLLPVAGAITGTQAYAAEGSVRYSADLLALVTPSFFHPIFGQWEYTHRVLGVNIDEGYGYVGLVAAVLALVAVWKVRAARWWLLLALVAWVFSLGPLLKLFDQPLAVRVGDYETFITLPGVLLERLPLLNLARTPGRFNFTVALAVAAMVGYGVAYLWPRLGRVAPSLMIILSALALFEYQAFWPLPTIRADVPAAIAALSQRDDARAVLNVPWDNLVAAKEALWLQTGHELPLIAGHVTRRTPVDPAMLSILEATFDPALLNDAGADMIIVHREYDADGTLEDRAQDQLGDPIYEDDRFVVFKTPETQATPAFTVLPSAQTNLTDQIDSYLYTDVGGWSLFEADLAATERKVQLSVDGIALRAWNIAGEQSLNLPLPLTEGYHTLTLAVEPSCPQVFNPALRCQSVKIERLSLNELIADPFEPVQFQSGVTLAGSQIAERYDDSLPVWLWWQFDRPLSDNAIRYVHLIDANGTQVAQMDEPLGARTAGEQLVETVTLPLPSDLAPGPYRVYVGWYTYPDLARFPVLSDVPGKENNEVLIGEFTIEAPSPEAPTPLPTLLPE